MGIGESEDLVEGEGDKEIRIIDFIVEGEIKDV